VAMVTGDRQLVAARCARDWLAMVVAERLPQNKVEFVRQMKAKATAWLS
jgi:cation transport ATPase